MLDSIQKHPNITEFGFAAAAVGVFELDHHLGAHENATRRTSPEFYTARPNGARHTLGVLPGCQIDSKRYFDSLTSFTTDTDLVVTAYPEHTFDVEQICEGLAKQLVGLCAERPSLLCSSMGGIVMRHFLEYCQNEGVTEKLQGFDTIVMDSSPFDGHDIKRPYRLLLTAAGVARNSRTLDTLKRLSMRSWDKSDMSADAHLDTIYAEGKFIDAEHPDGPLPDVMDAVYYVTAANDRVINTDQAASKYSKIVPSGKFRYLTDTKRPARSHTAGMANYRYELELTGIHKLRYSREPDLLNLRPEPIRTILAA